jgi:hypothetical protein
MNLPEVFQKSIPVELRGGLRLVEVRNRCDSCEPWRYIEYYSNSGNQPVRREKVTVQAGYRAIYAYPGTHYFSNTKIEKSAPGSYENDRRIVVDALRHEYARKKERVAGYLAQNPGLKQRMEPFRARGKNYIDFEQSTYKGYDFVSYTENVIGLTGSTISQIHIFVPNNEIIVTAYLLKQEKAKFRTIDEFLELRRDFIEGYIDFLVSNSGEQT